MAAAQIALVLFHQYRGYLRQQQVVALMKAAQCVEGRPVGLCRAQIARLSQLLSPVLAECEERGLSWRVLNLSVL